MSDAPSTIKAEAAAVAATEPAPQPDVKQQATETPAAENGEKAAATEAPDVKLAAGPKPTLAPTPKEGDTSTDDSVARVKEEQAKNDNADKQGGERRPDRNGSRTDRGSHRGRGQSRPHYKRPNEYALRFPAVNPYLRIAALPSSF